MSVDFTAPLLGCMAAMVVHHDTWLIGQPLLQVGLVGLLGRPRPPACGHRGTTERLPSTSTGWIRGVGHPSHFSGARRVRGIFDQQQHPQAVRES
jgi:hypothetical protein